MRRILILLQIIISATFGYSQDSSSVSMITNRPGATEASTAVYKGGFQIEASLEYGKIPERKGTSDHSEYLFLPSFGLLYGVSENVELRVFAVNYATRSNLNGGYTQFVYNLSDVFIGTKINLLKSKGLVPELALIINQGFPSNPSNVRKQWPTTATFAWSYSLPANFGLSGNLGYINEKEVFDQNVTFDHGWLYTLNLGYAIKDDVGVFVEIFGEDNMNDDSPIPLVVNGGAWYRFNPKLQIDASAGYGFEVGNYYFNVGMSLLILK